MKDSLPSRLVAIVGGSGAGKSRLANVLQSLLGDKSCGFSLDDFYRDRSHLPPGRRSRLNFDHPRAIDWPYLEQVLRLCQSGRAARLPRYDFTTHTRLAARELWHPKPLVLVDGLWLLLRPAVRRIFELRIFIKCSARLRLSRRLARDKAERDRSPAGIRRQFATTVAPMHDRYVAPQVRWADVVLSQIPPFAEVQELASRLWALLKTRSPFPALMPETFCAELSRLLTTTRGNHE
jgi:uridine kinase